MLTDSSASLESFAHFTGEVAVSIDGVGINGINGVIKVWKGIAGSTVKGARLFWGSLLPDLTVNLRGIVVPCTLSATTIGRFQNCAADVTDIVKAFIDAAAPGELQIPYSESNTASTHGGILAVVFDLPPSGGAASQDSVTLLFGVTNSGSATILEDRFIVELDQPYDPVKSSIYMSLGIGFSSFDNSEKTVVIVNGVKLTSNAGGFEDGVVNLGGLLTVGDFNDNPANPSDPNGSNSPDDELYTLTEFVPAGATSFEVKTQSSGFDNIFFAAVVVEANVVTSSPSASPTADPTSEPTAGPSLQPTSDPSAEPSVQPSAAPTHWTPPTEKYNTLKPKTNKPTKKPAQSPSRKPTKTTRSKPSKCSD